MRLTWVQSEDSRYESSVDRAVLYPRDAGPVVWPGVISVDETFDVSDRTPLYLDGDKYLDFVAVKEFKAKLAAFGYPKAFRPCLGQKSLIPGFIITNQIRERFNLSYRTKVGESHYKLHLVYNALAIPDNISYKTAGLSIEPNQVTFNLETVPERSASFPDVAHLVFDSRTLASWVWADLQDVLYGTPTSDPYFPTPDELRPILDSIGLVEDSNDPGTYLILRDSVSLDPTDPGTYLINRPGVYEDSSDSGTYLMGVP